MMALGEQKYRTCAIQSIGAELGDSGNRLGGGMEHLGMVQYLMYHVGRDGQVDEVATWRWACP